MKVISKIVLGASLLGGAAIAACSNGAPEQTSVDTAAGHRNWDSGASNDDASAACDTLAFSVCSDAQVLAIASALNRGEILEAQAVIGRGESPEVKAFAQRMIDDHTRLETAMQELASRLGVAPMENAISQELTQSAQDEAQKLQMQTGKALDQMYITHEMVEHFKAYSLVRSLLIPSARPELRAGLVEARAAIAAHIELAVTVQSTVVGRCGSPNQNAGADAGCDTDAAH